MYRNKEMLRGDALVPRLVSRALSRVPYSQTRTNLIHNYRRRQFNAFLADRLGSGFHATPAGAVPPLELILQTKVHDEGEVSRKSNAAEYISGSYMGMLGLLHLAEKCGLNIRTVGSILEFGTGTANNLRLFRSIDGVRLVGSDVNPSMIEWCKDNLSGIEFYLNELEPPLAFADDDSFDYVFATSVFTHIPLEWQDAWLKEIRRVLRPGGIFVCTVAGSFHTNDQLTPEQLAELEEQGSFTLTSEDSGASLATKHAGSWDVFQTRARVIEAFGSVFDIRDYVATSGQDVLALAKPDQVSVTPTRELARELAEEHAA